MEFVTIGLLMAGFDSVNTFMLTLFVNGRHFFYGLSACYSDMCIWDGNGFLQLRGCVMKAFAINVSTKLPDDVDENGSTSMYRGLIISSGFEVLL